MPARTSRRRATSSTVRAIGPGLSWLALMGTTPCVDTAPTVGLIPATPLSDAGQVMDPSVSVPMASGARPAATAAADPEEDPPGLRSRAQGLPVSPPMADQPDVERIDRILAHSDRLVVPENDGAGVSQPTDQGGIGGGGTAGQTGAPGRGGQTGNLDVVLDQDRDAVQGASGAGRIACPGFVPSGSEMANTLRRAVDDSGRSRAAIRASSSSTRTRAGTPLRCKVNTSAKARSSSTGRDCRWGRGPLASGPGAPRRLARAAGRSGAD